jgi:hypothetical protein
MQVETTVISCMFTREKYLLLVWDSFSYELQAKLLLPALTVQQIIVMYETANDAAHLQIYGHS